MDSIQRKVMKFFLVTNEKLNHIKCMVFSRIQIFRFILRLLTNIIFKKTHYMFAAKLFY